MQILRIPKGNGKFRTVYAPGEPEKEQLRNHMPRLIKIALARCHPRVVHGFMPGKSPLTNALMHVGFEYTLNVDLKDFFDTVVMSHVLDIIPADILADVMRYGAARQGLPTSPIVANIAAAAMDWEFLAELPAGVVYTRYADDMSFSFNEPAFVNLKDGGRLMKLILELVEKHKFVLNTKKTNLQHARAGRRVITGVAIEGHRAWPTRAVRRRLRAARHQGNPGSTAGLREWCRLKLPALYLQEIERRRQELNTEHAALPEMEDKPSTYGKQRRPLQLE